MSDETPNSTLRTFLCAECGKESTHKLAAIAKFEFVSRWNDHVDRTIDDVRKLVKEAGV